MDDGPLPARTGVDLAIDRVVIDGAVSDRGSRS
jgi:hypothetical protein